MRNVGNYIRDLRKEEGLTARSIAKSLEVSASYVSQVELGHKPLLETAVEVFQKLLPKLDLDKLRELQELDKISNIELAPGATPQIALVLARAISDSNLDDHKIYELIETLNKREANDNDIPDPVQHAGPES